MRPRAHSFDGSSQHSLQPQQSTAGARPPPNSTTQCLAQHPPQNLPPVRVQDQEVIVLTQQQVAFLQQHSLTMPNPPPFPTHQLQHHHQVLRSSGPQFCHVQMRHPSESSSSAWGDVTSRQHAASRDGSMSGYSSPASCRGGRGVPSYTSSNHSSLSLASRASSMTVEQATHHRAMLLAAQQQQGIVPHTMHPPSVPLSHHSLASLQQVNVAPLAISDQPVLPVVQLCPSQDQAPQPVLPAVIDDPLPPINPRIVSSSPDHATPLPTPRTPQTCELLHALRPVDRVVSDLFSRREVEGETVEVPKGPPNFLQWTPHEPSLRWSTTRRTHYSEIETLTYKYNDEFSFLVPVVVDALETVMKNHGTLPGCNPPYEHKRQDKFVVFETLTVPETPMIEFFNYITRESCCSPSTFLASFILLDRFLSLPVNEDLHLNPYNCFKLMTGAFRIVSKVMEVRVLNNQFFAESCRVTPKAVNDLEVRLLTDLNFDVAILQVDFLRYASRVTDASCGGLLHSARFFRHYEELASRRKNASSREGAVPKLRRLVSSASGSHPRNEGALSPPDDAEDV